MTTETPTPETTETTEPEATTFTQADVDRIVRERVKRERDKYADYDDLKAKAGEATTLEQRVADIERKANDSEARAIRAEIANAKGLTATQAKRLVGTTREELEADADELLTDIGAQKQNGNRAPREGQTPPPSGDDEVREFTRGLFKRPE
ncbi:MAG: hypothetical protein EOP24_32065 [Hyphomicrobiales bacterium]|nr:MAG: hypothetical protein EOP24_32065 [Hyphomicrobiales bacterium]